MRKIVILQDDVASPLVAANDLLSRHGGQGQHVYRSAIRGFSIEASEAAIDAISRDSRVRYVIDDVPMEAFAQVVPTGADRTNVDANPYADIGGNGGEIDVDIAIIDTGIDLDHPDLNVHRAANFADREDPADADDGHGHGTHVAGTAAALDNDINTVGIAPGARLWAVRVLDDRGSGYLSSVIAGVDYVTEHAGEIEVANMSLGGYGSDDGDCGRTNNDALHEAICKSVEAGVVYVVAAGNSSSDSQYTMPASYDEVITVSALADSDGVPGAAGAQTSYGPDDTLASFSNYGADVDIAAPGVDILSSWKDGGTYSISGTSMASPHVAGAAALYMALTGLRPADALSTAVVKDALVSIGFAQDSADGFTGDDDGSAEPLLNAEGIGEGAARRS